MKHFTILLGCLLVIQFSSNAQNKSKAAKPELKLENTIQQYWFVMLLKGENRTQDSATAAKIQEGHMANINKLYNDGKLKVAGPFGDDGNWRGIFIFDCKTKEEAEKIAQSDPAVAAGLFAVEVSPWYSAPIGSFVHGKPNKPE